MKRLLLVVLMAAPLGRADAAAQTTVGDLKRVNLETLVNLQVTSVSRREQRLLEAPSAIFVITADDIRRSGATTIADVLRLAPGLQVASIDANKWAVSSRGFNGRFANKMLVLIDGRSVYTPLFSGVYWDVQDTLLGDIERIEVIRGPGATLWGANAVNGVINIITRRARDTRGVSVSALAASSEHVVADARYGGPLGPNGDLRLFLKYFDREPGLPRESGVEDAWHQIRGGFRVDWGLSPDDGLTLQGEVYDGAAGQTYGPGSLLPFFTTRWTTRAALGGGHVLARWTRGLSPQSDVALQVYYDRSARTESLLGERRDTVDADFQHHVRPDARHDVVWGVGYRTTHDDIESGDIVQFPRASRRDGLFSLFAQDEVTLVPQRVRLTAGTKVEHNAYTGWELQPSARGLVLFGEQQSIWAAVSRAVRTPSRAESDIVIAAAPQPGPTGIPLATWIVGSPAMDAETLRAHEIGYRAQPGPRVTVDVAGFHNVYDRLRTFEPGVPARQLTPAGPVLVVPASFGNLMSGTATGLEVAARWTPTASWVVDGSYSHLRVALRHHPESRDTLSIVAEDNSPRHQARLHAGVTLGRAIEIDGSAGYVGRLRNGRIGSRTRVDARIGWRVAPRVTIALAGRNLLEPDSPEFASTLGEVPTIVPRSALISVTVAPRQ